MIHLRCRMASRCLSLLLAARACVTMSAEPPPPASAYRITGVVVSSVDGSPVPHTRLTPSLTQQRVRGPGRQFPTVEGFDADEHGRFAIALPSAGAWRLVAAAAGYVSQAYKEHQNYSSAIVLTAATPAINLRFELSPEGGITGAVLDEAGEAVRDARVGLLVEQLPSPGRKADPFQIQTFAQTDDRGVYEFSNLAPGRYRLLVEAKPWYASTAQARRLNSQANSAGSAALPPDPSLDVTYQLTWYPGVDNSAEAETLDLHAGDVRRADFHLVPIPSVHLKIFPPPAPEQAGGGGGVPAFPVLERMDTGIQGMGFAQIAITNGPQGQIDVGGLAPGPYRVRLAQQNGEPRTALVEISDGSARIVDFNAVPSSMANVSVNVDNGEAEDRPIGMELVDAETGQRFFPFGGGRSTPVMRRGPQTPQPRETSFQVPPGRYEVNFAGRGETYLTGISAQGAEVTGRFVTFHAGDATLTLHTASGHATVTGVAALNGAPSVGAMVLLVPAGLDDPGSFATVVRDQTNTDGSFDLLNVIPGQYILIAIDHGWSVNLNDPSTLRRYLSQGVPLELRANQNLRQNITTQAP